MVTKFYQTFIFGTSTVTILNGKMETTLLFEIFWQIKDFPKILKLFFISTLNRHQKSFNKISACYRSKKNNKTIQTLNHDTNKSITTGA